MLIPPRFLDELKSRLSVSDIIGRKISITRAGREFKACCPFHKEKTPSFTINDDKQFYHCFGCGAHGSVIDFTMQYENLSFPEAIESLANLAGLQVPQATPEERQKAKIQKDLYSLMECATTWMEDQLRAPENKAAYTYILERGLSEETLRAFRIGYAPADRHAMRKHLAAQGYTDTQMREADLLRSSDKTPEPYAFFRERMMFPVTDTRGRVVAFGGRILPDNLRTPSRGDYTPAKYMNSSDTPLFHKGRTLYGQTHARQAASDNQPVFVVEGYMDAIAAFQAGCRGAVAPMGTALTEEQILHLWRLIPKDEKAPILCFDGDIAGQRAAARAAERVLPLLDKPGQTIKIAFLPEGQDPDSLIKAHGAGAFKNVLETAIPLVDFLWQTHTQGKSFDTPESRAALSAALERESTKIPERHVQYYYRQAFRDKMWQTFRYHPTSKGQRQSATYQNKGRHHVAQTATQRLKKPIHSRDQLTLSVMLACLINHPALFEYIEDDLEQLPPMPRQLSPLFNALLAFFGEAQDKQQTTTDVQEYLKNAGFESELKGLLNESLYTHASFARPQSEEETVLDGWRKILNYFDSAQLKQDMQRAHHALSQDMCEENEKKLQAFYEIQEGTHKRKEA